MPAIKDQIDDKHYRRKDERKENRQGTERSIEIRCANDYQGDNKHNKREDERDNCQGQTRTGTRGPPTLRIKREQLLPWHIHIGLNWRDIDSVGDWLGTGISFLIGWSRLRTIAELS